MLYLVGISEEVQDIMNVTGFDSFFDAFSTVEECLSAINN
jgi:anti-sigma B factor antagonist